MIRKLLSLSQVARLLLVVRTAPFTAMAAIAAVLTTGGRPGGCRVR